MEINAIIKERHSVRTFKNDKIDENILKELYSEIEKANKDGNINMKLVLNEPNAINTYKNSRFKNADNYIVLKGIKSNDLYEKCGYYGEKIVLKAQELGLNTCWIAGTYNKKLVKKYLEQNEKLVCIIAIGYGENVGMPHKNRSIDNLCKFKGDMPRWFLNGTYSAMDAPTALNQQKFKFVLVDENSVHAKRTGGVYSKIDLGIVKYHFEVVAGKENFKFV